MCATSPYGIPPACEPALEVASHCSFDDESRCASYCGFALIKGCMSDGFDTRIAKCVQSLPDPMCRPRYRAVLNCHDTPGTGCSSLSPHCDKSDAEYAACVP